MVILCARLVTNASGLDLNTLISWIEASVDAARVRLLDDVCNAPRTVRDVIDGAGVDGIVVGLCSTGHSDWELRAQIKKAGLDPLGAQVVTLQTLATNGTNPTAWAKAVIAGAIARARAYPGSRPDTLKPVLASSGHKVSRRSLFTIPPITYVPVPRINGDRCAAGDGCDLCVLACPHGALERDVDVINVVSAQCQSCGVCVGTCPQRAVEFPGYSPYEIEAQVASLLDDPDVEQPRVRFACSKNTEPPEPGWMSVPVACAGMIPTAAVLRALASGASSVGIRSCGDTCTSGLRETVRARVEYCRELLELMGDPSPAARVSVGTLEEPTTELSSGAVAAATEELGNVTSTMFGHDAASQAIHDLAVRYGTSELMLDNPESPVGIVEINERACTGCQTCVGACPTKALSADQSEAEIAISFDGTVCVACGQCVSVCPEIEAGAIMMRKATDLSILSRGRQVVYRGTDALCERCGATIAPQAMLDRIAELLGEEGYAAKHTTRLCINCRGH